MINAPHRPRFGAACPGWSRFRARAAGPATAKQCRLDLDVIAGKLRPKPAKPPTLGRHLLERACGIPNIVIVRVSSSEITRSDPPTDQALVGAALQNIAPLVAKADDQVTFGIDWLAEAEYGGYYQAWPPASTRSTASPSPFARAVPRSIRCNC